MQCCQFLCQHILRLLCCLLYGHTGETWNGELETDSLVVSGFSLVLAVCLFTSQALSHASYKADRTFFFFLHRTGLFAQKKQVCDVNTREDKQMSHIR